MCQVERVFSGQGFIARRLADYEERPQQQAMAEAVAQAITEPQHLCVEAGTGVGKTFAYLVPAIHSATEHDARIVISTHTIALQEQLLNKDIPFLNAVLPQEFTAALMKGRGNYLGLRRLEQASKRQNLLFKSGAQITDLWHLAEWAQTTTDGSLSDLDSVPSSDVWDKVKSEHGNCMGHRCRHYSACFYQKARRRAHNAQMIVVNHSLFFADLALRQDGVSVLPDYDVAILDEAHTIARVARESFGATLSSRQIVQLLHALYNPRTRRGFLATCHAESAIEVVQRCLKSTRQLFDELLEFHQGAGSENGRWHGPPPLSNPLTPCLRQLYDKLSQVRGQLTIEDDLFELSSAMDRCRLLGDLVQEFLQEHREDYVYWMERSQRRDDHATLYSRPLDVSHTLEEVLFNAVPSVILTSATLSTHQEEDFGYFREQIGLRESGCLRLGSPFDLHSQIELNVEAALPDPRDLDHFVPQAAELIERYVRRSEGRTLVLFTSYSMMDAFRQALEARFEALNYTLLVQGQQVSRTQMLEQLRHHPQTVLFGTDSFWEGVDVKGDALRSVIITKLPFDSPQRPLTEARIAAIQARGGNPFHELQLPEAVLKFKQGVGRLIRSHQDRGTLVILDSRICRKHYGRYFLDAIPECIPIINDGT